MNFQRALPPSLLLIAASWPLLSISQSPIIPGPTEPCLQIPEPARWLSAGEPDIGIVPALISAHRGGTTLAPENTMWAYRYAYAYEVAMIEVDVRQTADGRFVAFHDSDIEAKSDGSGRLEDLSFEQARALNVAAYEPWIGSIYDPAQMASLEEVLELAQQTQGGVEFDMKFMLDSQPMADLAGFSQVVNAYPDVLQRSIINLPPGVAQLAQTLIPEGRFIYNLLLANELPAELYALTPIARVFGSKLKKFTSEHIAAIHDGCGLVMPHAYDEGGDQEAAQMLLALSLGADGVQTNQPVLARSVLIGPVDTHLIFDPEPQACLQNLHNTQGLPEKDLLVHFSDGQQQTLTTGLAGCVSIASADQVDAIRFDGDASAKPSGWQRNGVRLQTENGGGGSLGFAWLWCLLAVWASRFNRRLGPFSGSP